MGRKRQRRELHVAMNGDTVGRLARPSPGQLQFQYDPSWLEQKAALPISLSMPLSSAPYSGDMVWNFFDNLLPDSNEIRQRLQSVLGTPSTRPFDLLERIGRDCVGALQLYPEGEEPPDVRGVEAEPVSDAKIAARLRSYLSHPLGMARDEEFRISIAGAQEKTALLWHRDGWHEPRGATPTTHILKLPIGQAAHGIDLSDSIENEWLCLRMARAFGLPVPRAEIRLFEDVVALVVERFDRRWSPDGATLIRLPQEDVCQALGLPPGMKYESDGGPGVKAVLDLLLQSTNPEEDRRAFFRALIVYWLLAAIDGHAKNFSVHLLSQGDSRLTPFYDIISAHPIVARKGLHRRELRMAMAVHGKSRHYAWDKIQGRHWLSTAAKTRFPAADAEAILADCVERGPEVVAQVAMELPAGFPQEVADPILQGVTDTLAKV